jgi:23S rRNA pseudouridine1911/1915/1917 synthase
VTFVADRGDVAHRLDQAVLRHVPGAFGLSRSRLQKLVAAGRVLVNGAPARRAAQRLAAGDVVALDAVAAPPPAPPAPESLPLDVVYEDDDLLVVCKPAGMVAHPTSRQRSGTVVNAVLGLGRGGDDNWSPRLVQRLDRDTSGLMIIARRGDVHTALQRDRDDIVKDYRAVVWGRPSPRQGAIDSALGRDPLDRRRMMVRDDGAPSQTTYAVLAHSTGEARGLSLVRCRLGTGRTHQIRVHLAERGWPIVGDQTYGHAPRRRLASPALDRQARSFTHQALHAWRLRLRLPSSGQVIRLEAPVPDDMRDLIAAAGLRRALTRAED